jgi:hypothetical protein
MNRFRILAALGLAGALAMAAPAEEAKLNAAWEKMKMLVGDWEGTAEGHSAKVSYRLVSSGTTLEESLSTPDGGGMVTMYHPDGSRILMTHYCSENNQPRLRAAGLSPDGKSVAFQFIDVTNLSSPDAPHMVGLVLLFQDADHMTQRWTHQTAPGKADTGDFQFTRKK